MIVHIFRLLLGMIICCVLMPLHAASLKSFVSGSYQQILNTHSGQPFLVALWSIDCPPCHEELDTLGEYVAQHPEARIILITTDDPSLSVQVKKILDRYRLEQVESWIFTDTHKERLRYEIDRRWYGELPTSLFYSADGSKKRIQGKISTDMLNELFDRQADVNRLTDTQ